MRAASGDDAGFWHHPTKPIGIHLDRRASVHLAEGEPPDLTLVSRQGNAWILPGQEDHVWVCFDRDISCSDAINPGENWTWTSWRVDGVKAELR